MVISSMQLRCMCVANGGGESVFLPVHISRCSKQQEPSSLASAQILQYPKLNLKKKKEVIHFQKQRKVTNVMNVGAILLQLVPLLLHPLFSPQALPYSPLCGKPVPKG